MHTRKLRAQYANYLLSVFSVSTQNAILHTAHDLQLAIACQKHLVLYEKKKKLFETHFYSFGNFKAKVTILA